MESDVNRIAAEIRKLAKELSFKDRRDLGRELVKATPKELQERARNASIARWSAREKVAA
jgi:hypothetical protein